jgi:hypothetical protein
VQLRPLTLFFQEHTTFGHDDGDIAVNIALAVLVDERNGDVRVRDALSQRHAEDALRSALY